MSYWQESVAAYTSTFDRTGCVGIGAMTSILHTAPHNHTAQASQFCDDVSSRHAATPANGQAVGLSSQSTWASKGMVFL
jgi:hypothetical protein